MRTNTSLKLIPALALMLAGPLLAQESTGRAHAPEQTRANAKPPTLVEAPMGMGAVVHGTENQRLGTVQDWVFDLKTGKISFVVVQAAEEGAKGQAYTVRYDRLTWGRGEQALQLDMTAKDLAAMPKYMPRESKRLGADSEPAGERGTAEGSVNIEQEGGATPREAKLAMQLPSSLAASEIVGGKLLTERNPFAMISKLVLEPKSGSVVFVLADRVRTKGGDPLVIPWTAMTWSAPEGQALQGALALTAEEQGKAPLLEGGTLDALADAEALRAIYAFYKVPMPSGSPAMAERKN